MADVVTVLWLLFVVAIGLATLSILFGWLVCRLAIAGQSDTTVVAKRLFWHGIVQWIFIFVYVGASVVGTLSVLDSLPAGLLVSITAGVLGGVVSTAKIVPLARFGMFDRLGYGSPREAAISTSIVGFIACGGVSLGFVAAATGSYATIPLGVAATIGYVALGPWLIDRSNETEPLPDHVTDRCAVLARSTDRPIRFRTLVDDQSPTAIASGVWPTTPTVYVPDRLFEDLEPAELDAVVAHEIGHIHNRHNERRALTYSAMVSFLLFGLLTVPVIGLAVIPVAFYSGRRKIYEEYDADAFAAAVTGSDATVASLERLASLGHLPRENSRSFDFLMEHPSLARRVERLTGSME